MRPELKASLAAFEELFDDLTTFLQPLDEAGLNWVPPAPDTNSIAVMVTHVVGSINTWLARAVGEPVARNRDAEFAARDSAPHLVTLIDGGRLELRRRYELLAERDLSTAIPAHRVRSPQEVQVSVAWCVEHALVHAGEHWGQIQLTRQLYDVRPR